MQRALILCLAAILAAPLATFATPFPAFAATPAKEQAAKKPAQKTAAKPAAKPAAKTATKKPAAKSTAKKTDGKKAAPAKGTGKATASKPSKPVAKPAALPPISGTPFRQALALLDRGRTTEAMRIAGGLADPILADVIRGEVYASGNSGASASEVYGFLRQYKAWPQRGSILAAAESYLSSDRPYEPLLYIYDVESQPVTSTGFDAWITTLRAAGKTQDAHRAIRARWRNGKLSVGSDAAFRTRYGAWLEPEDDAVRSDVLSGGEAQRWKETHVQIRDLLSQRNYGRAYQLASGANLSPGGNDYATSEFLAGWLALRFMRQPQAALNHFQHIYDNVKTPVSKSRAVYWMGRAYESMGRVQEATKSYEEGATYQAFFYGQLSMAKIYANSSVIMPPEPQIPQAFMREFYSRPLPHAARALAAAGDKDRAARYLRAMLPSLTERSEFVLADDIAQEFNIPFLEVQVAKAANTKNIVLNQRGYPVLNVPRDGMDPEPALTLGIIRQESEFRTDVQSPVGATGIMQLMPTTARAIAKEIGVSYSDSQLNNPSYNMTLGRAYLGKRIREWNGSYVLAIASYNAGKGRVSEWVEVYGDPRSPNIDPVDWIEMIPVYETRNYVQRVLEGTQVYRARLAGDKAPLGILRDLTR